MAGDAPETQGNRLQPLTRSPGFHCLGSEQSSRAVAERLLSQRWERVSAPGSVLWASPRRSVRRAVGTRAGVLRMGVPAPGLQPLFSASAGVTGVLVSRRPWGREEVPRLLGSTCEGRKVTAGLLGTFWCPCVSVSCPWFY